MNIFTHDFIHTSMQMCLITCYNIASEAKASEAKAIHNFTFDKYCQIPAKSLKQLTLQEQYERSQTQC